ncbi:MAG: CPP1-like family protein [Microcystaceae cyanobacterium]
MSEHNPYEQLGVTEDSSFEEIQAAKNRLSEEYRSDATKLENLEAAYDAVIMDRLRMRQEGRIKVPDRIRFPERSLPKTPSPTSPSSATPPAWLQGMLDRPSQSEWLWPSAIFGGCAIIASLTPGDASNIAIWLTLGTVANLYFINRKEKKFGRALLWTLGGLIAGIGLGTLLAMSLQASGLFPVVDPAHIAVVTTLILFWLSSCFLR